MGCVLTGCAILLAVAAFVFSPVLLLIAVVALAFTFLAKGAVPPKKSGACSRPARADGHEKHIVDSGWPIELIAGLRRH